MGKMSRDKGKVGEREVVQLIRAYGFEARRGQQFRGGGDSPDIIHNVPGIEFEVKRREQLNLYEAMAQVEDDIGEDNKIGVVAHRKNNQRWLATLDLRDFLFLMTGFMPRDDEETDDDDEQDPNDGGVPGFLSGDEEPEEDG